jgi:hypothetical protein
MMRQLEYMIGINRNHYLKNTVITPPALGIGYELTQ